MSNHSIYVDCSKCGGDGEFPNSFMTYEGEVLPPENPRECEECGGSGKVVVAAFGDLGDRLNDILDKCSDIFEKVSEE